MSPVFADLAGDIDISFEFFPPKTDAMAATLWETVAALGPYDPRFVSVTYGAGGSTRERTHATVTRIEAETGIPAAAHLTCVGASRGEVLDIARSYWAAGIRHIVALRGDPPVAGQKFEPHPDGFAHAAELTAALLGVAPFEISVAAYPEVHPDALSAAADLDFLKRKIDAGARRGITQAFFDVDAFLRFRDRAVAAGIGAELVPGILPIVSVAQARKFARTIPEWMDRLLDGLDAQPQARPLVAAAIAAEMCRLLYAEGVRQFHFYTLNKAALTAAVCHMLGRKAALQPAGLALASGIES
jgi:methylenetetrahydrofolate reductase (NADPH)